MKVVKRITIVVGIVIGLTIVAVAAWDGVDPDNPVANQLQLERGNNVPGEITRITSAGPIDNRMVVILMHGWSTGGWLSKEEVTHTFENLMIDWRGSSPGASGIFVTDLGVDFDKYFVAYTYHYDSRVGVDENGRRAWKKIEGNPELTERGIMIVPVAHSMGGLVAQAYRTLEEHKCIGLLGEGVPVNGSPATDLSRVTMWANSLAGSRGPRLVKTITAGIDFDTDGMRWLSLNYLPRQKLFDTKPLDGNCYLYAGAIEPMPMKWTTVGWHLGMLADAAKLQGDDYQKAMIAYPFAAAMIEGCGGGPNDGMVPVNSALANGVRGNAIVRKMGEYNHSQIIRGSGDLALHRQMAYDLWAIYQRATKQNAQFGVFDLALPDWPGVSESQNFGPKVDEPIKVWWQDGSTVMALNGDNSQVQSLGVKIESNREVAIDSTGWRLAAPTMDGIRICDLRTGEARIVLKGTDVTAVGWADDKLLAVYNHGLWLMNSSQQIERNLARDEKLVVSTRLVTRKDSIYLANDRGDGRYDVYRIPITAHQLTLGDERIENLIQNVSYQPRAARSAIVGIYQEDKRSKVQWVSTGLASLVNLPARPIVDKLITGDVLGSVDDLAMTAEGAVYLEVDGQIRAIDLEMAKLYGAKGFLATLRAKLEAKPEGFLMITPEELERLAPVVGQGNHLGAN